MKLLIIAGPYEADRIRRAAVAAGFETVAVEPGESLSGWITASRPDLIVMAPQIVNADPAVALAKVRSVPRGRVPIFLVGETTDEPRMKGLADGFFVRPVSTGDLVARARARLGGTGSTGVGRRALTGENAVPVPIADASTDFARGGGSRSGASGPFGAAGAQGSGPQATKPSLRPLVSAADASGPVQIPKARPSEAGALFVKLAESIDATLDAEMNDVAQLVGALRPTVEARKLATGKAGPPDELERTPMAPMTALAAAAAMPHVEGEDTLLSPQVSREALQELRDDGGQRTVAVPSDAFKKMSFDRGPAARRAAPPPAGTAPPLGGTAAPLERGRLAESDIAALLGRMMVERLTGRLVLRRPEAEKMIYFDRGAPILAGSSDPQDRMGEMLVRQGRLTDEQQARAADALAGSGRRLGVTLVEMGIIKVSELALLVRRHYEEIIHSVFAWEEGDWSMGPERPTREENVLLTDHPAALILEGIRRKYGASRLRRCLGGGGQIFRLPAAVGTSEILLRMRLFHEERAVVPLFDGVRTLDEVCALTEAPDEVVCGVAWALSVLGQLERIEPRADDAAPGNGDGRGGDARAGARDVAREAARDLAIDRARVLSRHALVEEGDYFQVLGVPRTASQHEVRRAHQALMRELAPAALDPALAAELAPELRAIRAVLDEALRVLGDPRMRERYQAQLPAGPSRRRGDAAPPSDSRTGQT